MNLLTTMLLFLSGLLIGSFLNVVAIRVLAGQSIAYPPSRCAKCEHTLGSLDLVPVFSYLFLRGLCRYCKDPISARYPIGELATGILFAITYLILGLQRELAVALFVTCILIVITQTDLQSLRIPNAVVAVGIAGAALLRLWSHPLPLWNYFAAMFVGSGILFLIGVITGHLLKKETMGGGDVKLYAFIGIALGIKLTLLSLFAASVCGLVFSWARTLAGQRERDAVIPFGPFIALGALIVYYYGDQVIAWYVDRFLYA
ncbi:prepilin peptidase [Cohnella yongneupensis]|uniref:Prepilin peptidase n=1 Tax=Cohnella yongneupensis TaxID=425006 RepID=A0ABW0R014_9BACL